MVKESSATLAVDRHERVATGVFTSDKLQPPVLYGVSFFTECCTLLGAKKPQLLLTKKPLSNKLNKQKDLYFVAATAELLNGAAYPCMWRGQRSFGWGWHCLR